MSLSDSETILAHLPMPIMMVDEDGIIGYVNDACESFLGRSRRRLEGSNVSDRLNFQTRRLNEALRSGGDDLTAEDVLLQLGNGDTNLDVTITRLDKNRLIILIPRKRGRSHISDRRDRGIQQAMGASAILSHEIKNPLAGIKGGAQLLAKKAGKDGKPLTDLIINEVDRIARLLDQMQDLGGTKIRQSTAENIHLLIEKAIRSIRAANQTIPNISVNYDPSLPDVLIDADGMVQILINLMQNALDALSGQDDAQIGISTRYVMGGALRETPEEMRDGTTMKLPVEVTISDNGPGIPEHIAEELFSPFVTTKREGQGLGLAIVRKLVLEMRARITQERSESRGLTLFKIYLPMADGKAAKRGSK